VRRASCAYPVLVWEQPLCLAGTVPAAGSHSPAKQQTGPVLLQQADAAGQTGNIREINRSLRNVSRQRAQRVVHTLQCKQCEAQGCHQLVLIPSNAPRASKPFWPPLSNECSPNNMYQQPCQGPVGRRRPMQVFKSCSSPNQAQILTLAACAAA
jgi:hypothetical protein